MATTAGTHRAILVESTILRQLTVFLFYFCQGIPLGLFYLAIPAYMAGSGATPGEIATVVGMTSLPWTLKLINGFIMDRYTYLPMGRRRIWIIGAQSIMIVGMLTGALLAPEGRDVLLLSTLAFVISAATTFQDVAIDGLVVDIMTDEEQARAGGIMFGAQALGMAGSTAANGWLIQVYGVSSAYLVSAIVLGIVIAYVVVVRERPGEKRLPWNVGQSSPRNLDIQVEAWWPLLKHSFKAILGLSSLMMIPFFLIRAMPGGANEVYYPIMTTTITGWSTSDYTNVNSASQLASAIFGLALGGWIIGKIGTKRSVGFLLPLFALLMVVIGVSSEEWARSSFMTTVIWINDFLGILLAIALIPIAMQLCSPAVAATQFTIYMALANFGRPIGAWIAAKTTGGDTPENMFFVIAALFALGAAAIWFVRLPELSKADEEAVEHEVAYGAGAAPVEN
ncbi:MFS transporter [Croceicoccus ponticola]|uniref:MFS transporter n=1 Tax=Croceicoccus ponticola TaxID=2217664 RepID=A0A437H139_9SPHN|nr:MFS transporter [Croceicoccus ponticola]RVQ69253.1 MFS transporter [Croceicoccus ponticola]